MNSRRGRGFAHRWDAVPADVWARTQLLYVCSPDNPTGRVMPLDEWRELFALSDRYGFVIASDECYSEIYFDEAKPPLGALGGRAGARARRLSAPRRVRQPVEALQCARAALGLCRRRRTLIKAFLHYRTYHGSAMSGAVAAASIAAWNDEAHVVQNRAEYAAKFAALAPRLAAALPCAMPEAAFYLWARTRRRRRGLRAPPADRGERDRAARQLHRAHGARRAIRARAAFASRWCRRSPSAPRRSSASSRCARRSVSARTWLIAANAGASSGRACVRSARAHARAGERAD